MANNGIAVVRAQIVSAFEAARGRGAQQTQSPRIDPAVVVPTDDGVLLIAREVGYTTAHERRFNLKAHVLIQAAARNPHKATAIGRGVWHVTVPTESPEQLYTNALALLK